MTILKQFKVGGFVAAFSLAGATAVLAEPQNSVQVAAPDDKAGGKPYSQYSSTSSEVAGTSKDSGTIPSGKRHRTHRKQHATETTEDSRTIQSMDPPAK